MASEGSGGLHYTRDGTEAVNAPGFTYSNPHGQRVGPRWVRGELVYALPLGLIHIDPAQQKWANEYVPVYRLDGPDGRPERVPGQYGVYDSKPGDPHYSPIWRYNYVLVPRDYTPNSLTSEAECLASRYQIVQTDTYTN
jgi:hypothetical protein